MTNAPSSRRLAFILCLACLGATSPTAVPGQAAGSSAGLGDSASPRFERVQLDGLSHQGIEAIVQDDDGFLWFGTADGLDRWDGREIVSYHHDPDDPCSLSHSRINVLRIDQSSRLWVGTEHGLNRFDRASGCFVRFLETPALSNAVWSIHDSSHEGLLVGTLSGLFRHESLEDRFDRIDLTAGGVGPSTPGVLSIQEDDDQTLWFLASAWPHDAQSAAIYSTSGALQPSPSFERWQLPPSELAPYRFLIDRQGRFWTGGAVPEQLDFERRELVPIAPGYGEAATRDRERQVVRSVLDSGEGPIVIGTAQGLQWADENAQRATLLAIDAGADWLSNYATALHRDDSGTLWVGTNNGLYRLDPARKPFFHLGHAPRAPETSLALNAVSSIAMDDQQDLWLGSWGPWVDRVDLRTSEIEHYGGPDQIGGLPVASSTFVERDPEGVIWVGAADRLCRYERVQNRFACFDLPQGSGAMRWVWDLAAGPSGTIFLGTNYSGVLEFDPRTDRFRPLLGEAGQALPRNVQVLTIEDLTLGMDASGKQTQAKALWVGGLLGEVARIDLGSRKVDSWTLSVSGRPIETVYDIQVARDGQVRVATSAGIFELTRKGRARRLLTRSDGLPGSRVYGLVEDREGLSWAATNRGLVRFDPDQPRLMRSFDRSDGLTNSEFNRHAHLVTDDGLIFLGGTRGLTWFDSLEIKDNPHQPRVALAGGEILDRAGTARPLSSPGQLELSHRDSNLTVKFAALSFTSPEKNHYRYRLEGQDDYWTEIGNRNFVTFTHLPAGNYRLLVEGSNNDGVLSSQPLTLPIIVAPPLWATWWFRILLASAFALALAAAYRLRIRRLIELERVRLRIASDLHDDLSSDLSGVVLAMDLLESNQALGDEDRERVSEVRTTIQRMIEGVRDIVWYVDPEHDSLSALARRMRTTARALLADREVEMVTELGSSALILPMADRRNLFLMFKEMLHNVRKHSSARHVFIRLSETLGRIELEVCDDGIGFDPRIVVAGHGLQSLERRASQLQGQLEIETESGAGTRMRFETRSQRRTPRRRLSFR